MTVYNILQDARPVHVKGAQIGWVIVCKVNYGRLIFFTLYQQLSEVTQYYIDVSAI